MSRFTTPPKHSTDEEFYVGYLSPADSGIRRFVTRVVVGLAALTVSVSLALVLLQSPFDPGLFHFGTTIELTGALEVEPVPRLLPRGGGEPHLLVGVGKKSVELAGLGQGATVAVTGTLIEAPAGRMLEVVEMRSVDGAPRTTGTESPASEVEMVGEIVDSKCFLGVMKPGRGKTHRSCASLCIRGGVPPGLFVDGDDPRLYVLWDSSGNTEALEWLDVVGEAVRVRGRASQRDGQWFLDTRRSEVVSAP